MFIYVMNTDEYMDGKNELTFKVHLFIWIFFSRYDCNSLELLKQLHIMVGQLIIIKVGYRGLIAQNFFLVVSLKKMPRTAV